MRSSRSRWGEARDWFVRADLRAHHRIRQLEPHALWRNSVCCSAPDVQFVFLGGGGEIALEEH